MGASPAKHPRISSWEALKQRRGQDSADMSLYTTNEERKMRRELELLKTSLHTAEERVRELEDERAARYQELSRQVARRAPFSSSHLVSELQPGCASGV
eukprot:768027-Hanusia_phi.AAC.7